MKPGDVIPSWSEDGNGYAIVTRTSRHRRTIDDTTARETLLTEAVLGVIGRVEDLTPWRAALEHATTCTWRSVTKREVETGQHECSNAVDCTPGSWCCGGQGAGWVEILDPANQRLYDLDFLLAGKEHGL